MNSHDSNSAVALPAPALRCFISQYAGFRATGVPEGIHFGLPSSEVDLIISLGPAIDLIRMPNPRQTPAAFTALVTGLQDAPAIVRQGREAFGLHVFIRPAGVVALLGIASIEISSLVVNLADIWGHDAGDLVETLRNARTWTRRFTILDRAFISRLRPTNVHPEFSWAWARLAKSHGAVPVHQLARETGYSRRHFSERFREIIGVTPKAAARVFRFERACRLIADRKGGLADVAFAAGYYDQAHLTREWYALAGSSPRAWIARELPFLQDYELGGRDNGSDELASLHQSGV